jgi:hypothetical protein
VFDCFDIIVAVKIFEHVQKGGFYGFEPFKTNREHLIEQLPELFIIKDFISSLALINPLL